MRLSVLFAVATLLSFGSALPIGGSNGLVARQAEAPAVAREAASLSERVIGAASWKRAVPNVAWREPEAEE